MNKKLLIKLFKFENILIGIMIGIFAFCINTFSSNSFLGEYSLIAAISVWFIVIFNHFISIPRYSEKDERELLNAIIASSVSISIAFFASFTLITFISVEAIELNQIYYSVYLLSTIISISLLRFGVGRFLNHYM